MILFALLQFLENMICNYFVLVDLLCNFQKVTSTMKFSHISFTFQIAIYGKNFCASAKDAFMLIMRNVVR